MSWYPNIQFVEGIANSIANWLSRYPQIHRPSERLSLPKVHAISHCNMQELDSAGDPHLKLVEQFLLSSYLPTKLGMDDRVGIKQSAMKYVIENGQLCRRLLHKAVTVTWQPDRIFTLQQYHTQYNHCGARKLLQVLLRFTWWLGISSDCQSFVRSCLTCQRFGRSYPHSNLHPLVTDAPMQVVSIDFISPLDVTRQGFKYICTIINTHTGYAKMQPTRSCDLLAAIQILKDWWIFRWGAPQILLADAAQAFGSRRWSEFLSSSLYQTSPSSSLHATSQWD